MVLRIASACLGSGLLIILCRARTRRTSGILAANYVFAWLSMLAAVHVAATELVDIDDLFFFQSERTRNLAEATIGYVIADLSAAALLRGDPRERLAADYLAFHAMVAFAFSTYLRLGSGGVCVVLSLIGELAGICIHHVRYAWGAGWHISRPRAYLRLFALRAAASVVCKAVCFTWLALRALREPRLWFGGIGTCTQLAIIVIVAVYGIAFSVGACRDTWRLRAEQRQWRRDW